MFSFRCGDWVMLLIRGKTGLLEQCRRPRALPQPPACAQPRGQLYRPVRGWADTFLTGPGGRQAGWPWLGGLRGAALTCLPGPRTLLCGLTSGTPMPLCSAPSVPGDASPGAGSAGTRACDPALCGQGQPAASCDLEAPRTGPWPGPGSGASEYWGWARRADRAGEAGGGLGAGLEDRAKAKLPQEGLCVGFLSPVCCLPLPASLGSAGSEAGRGRRHRGPSSSPPTLGAEWDAVDPTGGARQLRSLHLPSLQHRGQHLPRHPAAGARCSGAGGGAWPAAGVHTAEVGRGVWRERELPMQAGPPKPAS